MADFYKSQHTGTAIDTAITQVSQLAQDNTEVKNNINILNGRVNKIEQGEVRDPTKVPISGGTMTGPLTILFDEAKNSANIQSNYKNVPLQVRHICGINSGTGDLSTLYLNYYGHNETKIGPGGVATIGSTGKIFGAVWNDYAEYRQSKENEAGRVVCENGNGTLSRSTRRLQPGAEVVSDTFGFAIGETEKCKCPIAVAGRVLAYPWEDRNEFKSGDPVCSGPNGTVSRMTRKEVQEYPDRIIGTVSEIPNYEFWGTENIEINDRIWIRIR